MKKILFLFITLSSISCNLSNNKTSDDYISEGLSKVNQADYKGAIADYDTAIMLNANNKRAYYHRGNAKGYLSDFKSAICDYDTALILDSNDVNNYLVYNARGDTKNNLAFLKSSWLDSSSYKNMSEKEITASFMAAIADSLDSKDYYLAAIADYTKAIELNSDNADSYFSRGF
jgi:tetratricopeptide (TPR) repeat protein